uniref:C-type lectin domain-containing protein n=1 Tax=Oryzias latipes TaxID=8090 RepID=A0A3B3I449_ORYLA
MLTAHRKVIDVLQKQNLLVSNNVLIFWKTGCPEKWIRFGSSCYFFSGESKTWDEAREFCRARGADLVVINTEGENVRYCIFGKSNHAQGHAHAILHTHVDKLQKSHLGSHRTHATCSSQPGNVQPQRTALLGAAGTYSGHAHTDWHTHYLALRSPG